MSVTEGQDGCSAPTGVCVSLLVNWWLMSHQICRIWVLGGKKPIVVEHA